MSKIGLVIKKEYLQRVSKKSFLLLTFLTPFLFAALVFVPLWLSTIKGDDAKQIAVIDATGKYVSLFRNTEEYIFINGVGYGIDGYCCEEGDRLRETTDKPINYTAIAIKGLLFKYKKTNAKVYVDGVCHEFKNVWLAPTMKGRTYGGGMIAAPDQNRNSGLLSVMIFTGKTKLGTLMIFPSIFKGEHVKKTKNVTVLTGKEIKVIFDSPRPLQIDGETISGVT